MNENRIEKTDIDNNRFIPAATFVFLSLYMLIPERAMIEIAAFGVSIIAYLVIKTKTIITDNFVCFFLLYTVLGFIVTIFNLGTVKEKDAYEFLIIVFLASLIYMLPLKLSENMKMLKAIICVSVVTLLGCLLQIIRPELLSEINMVTLGSEKYLLFKDFFNSGYIVGFSYQTAVTGFYLSILLCWLFVNVFFGEKVKIHALLTIAMIGIAILLFMTAKRIFIFLVLSAFMIVGLLKYKKKALKLIVIIAVGLVFIKLMISSTNVGEKIIERMNRDDPTRGRYSIYIRLIKMFGEKPVFGNGIGSTLYYITDHSNGHNIYLQVLAETGIVGFALIVPQIFVRLGYTIKKVFYQIENNCVSKYLVFSLLIQVLFIGWGFTGNPLYDVYPLIIYIIGSKVATIESSN